MSKAIKLAETLEKLVSASPQTLREVAAELRRLAAENAELALAHAQSEQDFQLFLQHTHAPVERERDELAAKLDALAQSERLTMTHNPKDWQNFNEGFKAGAEEMRNGLLQLCKDFSDLKDRPYMGDVHAQVNALLGLVLSEIPQSLAQPEQPAAVPEGWQLVFKVWQRNQTAPSEPHHVEDARAMVSDALPADSVAAVLPNGNTATNVYDAYQIGFAAALAQSADAKDAARYRWLRNLPKGFSTLGGGTKVVITAPNGDGWSHSSLRGETLDAAIDAAMQGKQEGE